MTRPASGWLAPAGWAALLVVGVAASLALVRAGHLIGYQHYVAYDALGTAPAWPWAVLGVQALLAVVGARQALAAAWRWAHGRMGWRTWPALGLAALTSAALSRRPDVYAAELVMAVAIQAVMLLTVLALARSLPDDAAARGGGRLARWLAAPAGRLDRTAVVAALFAIVTSALLAVVAYGRHPHIPDEVSYLLQARYFASGMLAMPAPPVPDAFNVDLMQYEPSRWFSPFPPGWPALLALGELAGAPWLVNPLLAGLTVLLAFAFVRRMYDVPTARVTVVLLATSPWFLFMSMSLMSHPFSLCMATLATVAVQRLRDDGRARWGWIGGIAIGLVSLMRPLEGVALAGLLGFWTLLAGGWRFRVWPTVHLALGALLVAVANLPYNAALTGRATSFPVMAYFDVYYGPGVNALGFGANRGVGWEGLDPLPGHGVADVLINTALNGFATNVELHGWAIGSLLVALLFAFAPAGQRSDRLLIVAIAAIVGVHALYWFSGGPDFGARYWYLVLLPAVILTARGLTWMAGWQEAPPAAQAARGARVMLAAGALCLTTLLLFVPWRAADKYVRYRRMDPGPRELAAAHDFGRSLVLVQGKRFPDYASAAAYNPSDLRDPPGPVFAWDRRPEVRAAVLEAYRDRPVYVIQGPTLTGGGYRLVAGPIPALAVDAAAPPIDPAWDKTNSNAAGVVPVGDARE